MDLEEVKTQVINGVEETVKETEESVEVRTLFMRGICHEDSLSTSLIHHLPLSKPHVDISASFLFKNAEAPP